MVVLEILTPVNLADNDINYKVAHVGRNIDGVNRLILIHYQLKKGFINLFMVVVLFCATDNIYNARGIILQTALHI